MEKYLSRGIFRSSIWFWSRWKFVAKPLQYTKPIRTWPTVDPVPVKVVRARQTFVVLPILPERAFVAELGTRGSCFEVGTW